MSEGSAARGAPRSDMIARIRALQLGTQLALLSALVTAVMVGGSFLVLRARAERDVRGVFVAELRASQNVLRGMLNSSRRSLLTAAALVQSSPQLRSALATLKSDANADSRSSPVVRETIQRVVNTIARDFGDLLVITDDSGRVLAAAAPEGAPAAGANLLRIPSVQQILAAGDAGADSAFVVLRRGALTLQVGCVPILSAGYPVGVLMLGERLDRALPSESDSAGLRVVVTSGSTVLLSTLSGLAPGATWSAVPHESGDGRLRFGDDDFVAATLPLGRGEDGSPATLYLMRSLTASMQPIRSALGRSFLLAGLFTVVLVGLGTALISRTTLRPLDRFVSFLGAGADARAVSRFEGPPARGEIGTLTEAYNRLVDSLSTQNEQLLLRTGELATMNESLMLEVRERARAEQALSESAEQLRQSQKMEALGTLAGGVAHDFNNLLSVILGYAQLTADDLPPDSQQRTYITQISSAADRATLMVRQLLAFSRKQVLQPQIVDLSRVVTGMQSLLRPLIREDIVLRIDLAPKLARIEADPGQLEQVILNLVVNARDAMPDGGTLVIATQNVELEERFSSRPEAIAGGPAVMLSVSDTGQGMDELTRSRIFEPFFTTKAPGKGTGLGLSTAYGVVRQSGGSITVYSELGRGSTFRCYFPRAVEVRDQASPAPEAVDASRGTETILLAEDEPHLRMLLKRTLTDRGYRVLDAADGSEALAIVAKHSGAIDLLLTDVVMPNVGGKELAERLHTVHPSARVLFISGYSDEAIWMNGMLTPRSLFLQKPLSPHVLARKIREVLDAEVATGEGAGR